MKAKGPQPQEALRKICHGWGGRGGESAQNPTLADTHAREHYRKMPSPRGGPEQATGELFSAIQHLDMDDGIRRRNRQLGMDIKPQQLTEKER